jgi:hypothetical protein
LLDIWRKSRNESHEGPHDGNKCPLRVGKLTSPQDAYSELRKKPQYPRLIVSKLVTPYLKQLRASQEAFEHLRAEVRH